jgi:MFS superfamily sulfate permease-like transporter
VLAEGYNLGHFRRDLLAALTVAIVALPLSMAIAVASGVSPERGLSAAVIDGILISALGGSRYQIGGPAGAFIVLVAATVTKFGLDGLLLTVLISGFMLSLIGLLRRWQPNWPGMLIAVVRASLAAWLFHLPATLANSRMGCLHRVCHRSRLHRCSMCCRPRSRSRCWGRSRACCPPRWLTA